MKQDKPKSRRGVRSVDLPVGRVSPDRAEAYGLNFDLWQKSYNAALASDLSEIRRAGEKWMSRLRGRKRVRVVSDFGTDLRFVTAAARPMVDDGIISSDDVRRGFVETSLPAGKFVSGILPGSAKGKICFTDPVFLMGRSVIGLQLELERGRLTHWSAKENADILTSTLGNRRSVGNYLGWFSIGLNSAVEPCMLDNSIVQNDVGIGFGPHPLVEPSKIRPRVSFEGTIGLVEIETG
jgi:leucyl aminopeptidase (aminopeptidase T)